MSKRSWILFALVGALVVSSAGYFGFSTSQAPEATPTPQTVPVTICDVEQTVTAPGTLVNVSQAVVRMPTSGRISSVAVRSGDRVQAGEVLAELDAVAATQAQLDVIEAREALEKVQADRTALDYPRATEDFTNDLSRQVKLARQIVAKLDAAYKKAEDPFRKAQALASLTAAKSELRSVESRLNWYVGKPTEAEIAAADSELALAQAKFDAAVAVLKSLEIRAPFDGIIFQVNAQAGRSYQAEESLFEIGDPKDLEVRANITEEDYPIVSAGQGVEVFFDARADVTAQGRVDRIVPRRIEGDRPRYNIFITLDEVPAGLADGMTADVAITIAKRDAVLCLPRSIVRASGLDEVTLKVWAEGKIESSVVSIGLRGDSSVEILSGLAEGDQVVIQ